MGCLAKGLSHRVSESALLKALNQQSVVVPLAYDEIGSIEKGKIANLLIFSSSFTNDDAVLYQHWVKGKPHILNAELANDIRGYYSIKMKGFSDAGFVINGSFNNRSVYLFTCQSRIQVIPKKPSKPNQILMIIKLVSLLSQRIA